MHSFESSFIDDCPMSSERPSSAGSAFTPSLGEEESPVRTCIGGESVYVCRTCSVTCYYIMRVLVFVMPQDVKRLLQRYNATEPSPGPVRSLNRAHSGSAPSSAQRQRLTLTSPRANPGYSTGVLLVISVCLFLCLTLCLLSISFCNRLSSHGGNFTREGYKLPELLSQDNPPPPTPNSLSRMKILDTREVANRNLDEQKKRHREYLIQVCMCMWCEVCVCVSIAFIHVHLPHSPYARSGTTPSGEEKTS